MKRVILLLLAAGFFSTLQAQDKSLLYEVSGKDLAQPSYLYGTFHLVCPSDLNLSDAIRRALADSRQTYLEIDFDDPSLQAKTMTAMTLADGKNLKDILKEEDYTALDTYLREHLGTGLAAMGTLKPLAVMSMMFVSILKCEPASYDVTFAQMAVREGKPLLGLETVEAQIAAMDSIPLDEQVQSLVDIARRPEEAAKEMSGLTAAYKAQDLPLLMKLMNDSQFDGGSDRFKEELLDKRNSSWIPVIEKAAHEKSTFFAFGAGHLGGETGVVGLLRQKGYTVKPLQ